MIISDNILSNIRIPAVWIEVCEYYNKHYESFFSSEYLSVRCEGACEVDEKKVGRLIELVEEELKRLGMKIRIYGNSCLGFDVYFYLGKHSMSGIMFSSGELWVIRLLLLHATIPSILPIIVLQFIQFLKKSMEDKLQ